MIWHDTNKRIKNTWSLLSFSRFLISHYMITFADWKKMHKMRVVSEVLFGANEDHTPKDSTLASSEKLLQVEGKVSAIHGFIKGGTCSQARVLAEACCCSQGTDVIIDDFSVFLDMERCKNWAHKIFSPKYLTIWRLVLLAFSQSTACLTPELHPELLSEGVEDQLNWFMT